MAALALLSRTPLLRAGPQAEPAPEAPPAGASGEPDARPMPFILAFMPYLLLITLSVISQIGPVKEAVRNILWALDYPAFETAQGFAVAAVNDYAPLRVLNHPAPLIFYSIVISRSSTSSPGGGGKASRGRR